MFPEFHFGPLRFGYSLKSALLPSKEKILVLVLALCQKNLTENNYSSWFKQMVVFSSL